MTWFATWHFRLAGAASGYFLDKFWYQTDVVTILQWDSDYWAFNFWHKFGRQFNWRWGSECRATWFRFHMEWQLGQIGLLIQTGYWVQLSNGLGWLTLFCIFVTLYNFSDEALFDFWNVMTCTIFWLNRLTPFDTIVFSVTFCYNTILSSPFALFDLEKFQPFFF